MTSFCSNIVVRMSLIQKHIELYQQNGVVCIPFGEHPLSQEQIDFLAQFPLESKDYESVYNGDSGDEHTLKVLRIVTDLEQIEHKYAQAEVILNTIFSNEMKSFLQQFSTNINIVRRCQINLIEKDGFVGKHIDKDSNPNWKNVVILHLEDNYEGGAYKVFTQNGKSIALSPPKGSLIISPCNVEHEVETVSSGTRKTLACFFSHNDLPNPRYI